MECKWERTSLSKPINLDITKSYVSTETQFTLSSSSIYTEYL